MRIATLKDGSRHIVFENAKEIIKWENTSNIETILRSECIHNNTCRGICVICDNFIQMKER